MGSGWTLRWRVGQEPVGVSLANLAATVSAAEAAVLEPTMVELRPPDRFCSQL